MSLKTTQTRMSMSKTIYCPTCGQQRRGAQILTMKRVLMKCADGILIAVFVPISFFGIGIVLGAYLQGIFRWY